MEILIFNDIIIELLKKTTNVILEICFDLTLDHLMLKLDLIITDMQKIKQSIKALVTSPIIESLEYFKDALQHIKVSHDLRQSRVPFDVSQVSMIRMDDTDSKTNRQYRLIDRDSFTDARNYFNQAIKKSRKAMSLETTGIENYIL